MLFERSFDDLGIDLAARGVLHGGNESQQQVGKLLLTRRHIRQGIKDDAEESFDRFHQIISGPGEHEVSEEVDERARDDLTVVMRFTSLVLRRLLVVAAVTNDARLCSIATDVEGIGSQVFLGEVHADLLGVHEAEQAVHDHRHDVADRFVHRRSFFARKVVPGSLNRDDPVPALVPADADVEGDVLDQTASLHASAHTDAHERSGRIEPGVVFVVRVIDMNRNDDRHLLQTEPRAGFHLFGESEEVDRGAEFVGADLEDEAAVGIGLEQLPLLGGFAGATFLLRLSRPLNKIFRRALARALARAARAGALKSEHIEELIGHRRLVGQILEEFGAGQIGNVVGGIGNAVQNRTHRAVQHQVLRRRVLIETQAFVPVDDATTFGVYEDFLDAGAGCLGRLQLLQSNHVNGFEITVVVDHEQFVGSHFGAFAEALLSEVDSFLLADYLAEPLGLAGVGDGGGQIDELAFGSDRSIDEALVYRDFDVLEAAVFGALRANSLLVADALAVDAHVGDFLGNEVDIGELEACANSLLFEVLVHVNQRLTVVGSPIQADARLSGERTNVAENIVAHANQFLVAVADDAEITEVSEFDGVRNTTSSAGGEVDQRRERAARHLDLMTEAAAGGKRGGRAQLEIWIVFHVVDPLCFSGRRGMKSRLMHTALPPLAMVLKKPRCRNRVFLQKR